MVPTIAFIIIIIVGFLAKRAVLDIMEWVRPLGPDNSQDWDARPHALPHHHHPPPPPPHHHHYHTIIIIISEVHFPESER